MGDQRVKEYRGPFNVKQMFMVKSSRMVKVIEKELIGLDVLYEKSSQYVIHCKKERVLFDVEIRRLKEVSGYYIILFKKTFGAIQSYLKLTEEIIARTTSSSETPNK